MQIGSRRQFQQGNVVVQCACVVVLMDNDLFYGNSVASCVEHVIGSRKNEGVACISIIDAMGCCHDPAIMNQGAATKLETRASQKRDLPLIFVPRNNLFTSDDLVQASGGISLTTIACP